MIYFINLLLDLNLFKWLYLLQVLNIHYILPVSLAHMIIGVRQFHKRLSSNVGNIQKKYTLYF